MDSLRGWVRLWWQQADDYDQLSDHLRARGLIGFARAIVGPIPICLGVLAMCSLWTNTGPRGVLEHWCVVGACLIAGGCAALWLVRWPTRRQSVCFAVGSSAGIALAALGQNDPATAQVACAAFATIAAYIAAFHTPPLMLFNLFVACATNTFEVVRSAAVDRLFAGGAAFAVTLLLIIFVPAGIQVLVRVLGTDAVQSEHDQLTGLLNRAGFYRRVRAQLEQQCAVTHIAVVMIDLDRFKQLNDRHGHQHGDDALVAVAAALSDNSGPTAVVARMGGEEFAVADLRRSDEIQRSADRLCVAVAALPFALTASVGTVGRDLTQLPADTAALLAELVDCADAAMYHAKRLGGNRAHHYNQTAPEHYHSRDKSVSEA